MASGTGDDGRRQRAAAGAAALRRHAPDGLGDELLAPSRRSASRFDDDHVHGHVLVLRVPAVVVGDERDGRVADLGLAGQLRLLQVGHADDVHPPALVEPRLGQRRELGPLHAHVGAAQSGRARPPPAPTRTRSGSDRDRPDARTRRAPRCRRPKKVLMRPRVRSKNWSGTTTSSGGYSSLRLPTALAEKIRSTPSSLKPKMLARKFSSDGQDPVAGPVPRQEGHAAPAQRRRHVGPAGLAERRRQPDLLAVGQLLHVVEPAPADDANLDRHAPPSGTGRRAARRGRRDDEPVGLATWHRRRPTTAYHAGPAVTRLRLARLRPGLRPALGSARRRLRLGSPVSGSPVSGSAPSRPPAAARGPAERRR